MTGSRSRWTWTSVLGFALLIIACGEPSSTGPADTYPQFSSSGATLIECPTDVSESASATVLATGGSVTLRGHEITLPVGAVIGPTEISLKTPVSNYMELEIRANGQDHFTFQQPVTVTIDYSRCTRSNINKAALSAWEIDPVTKALLTHMGGTDDKASRTVTFSTGHLSGYSIAE